MKSKTGILGVIVISFIFIMFFGISTILIKQSVEKNIDYYKNKDAVASVFAVVSDVDVYEDSDDNKEYKTYIDYEYDGKKYTRIYWDTFSSKKEVGERVTVKVKIDNPADIFADDIGVTDLNIASYMFCIVMNVLLLIFCIARERENELKVINADEVYSVTRPELTLMMIFLTIACARIITIYMYPTFVNFNNSTLSTFLFVIVSILLLLHKLIKSGTYSFTNYYLTNKKCTEKHVKSDSETSDKHYLIFGSEKVLCDAEMFSDAVVGDAFWVLSNEKGKILKAYDTKNWTMDLNEKDDILYRKKSMKNLVMSVVGSLIIAIAFVAYFSIILNLMNK